MSVKFTIKVNKKLCKGCNICVEFCPKNVLKLDSLLKAYAIRPEDCIGCLKCEYYCPDFAIAVNKLEINGKKESENEN